MIKAGVPLVTGIFSIMASFGSNRSMGLDSGIKPERFHSINPCRVTFAWLQSFIMPFFLFLVLQNLPSISVLSLHFHSPTITTNYHCIPISTPATSFSALPPPLPAPLLLLSFLSQPPYFSPSAHYYAHHRKEVHSPVLEVDVFGSGHNKGGEGFGLA